MTLGENLKLGGDMEGEGGVYGSMEEGGGGVILHSNQKSLHIKHGCCFSLIMFSGSRSSLGFPKFSPVA